MEVVTHLCFSNDVSPHDDVVEILLRFITLQPDEKSTRRRKMTKELSVIDDAIDTSPTVRSLLLQLLLRAR